MPHTFQRTYPPHAFDALIQHGYHPVLARVYAARGIEDAAQLDVDWPRLIPFDRLKNVSLMARFLAEAILARKPALVRGSAHALREPSESLCAQL